MPPTFTAVLAEHLARISGRLAREAEDGEAVDAGRIYLAPGGRHMRVVRGADGPRDRARRRSADQFLQARGRPVVLLGGAVWGAGSLALVLTGMGSDGTRGAHEIVAAGGSVIAQDEATSVVWGMPRRGGAGRLVLGRAAARSDRAEDRPPVRGRPLVTPHDYDYLRKLLKERSGLVLSADKQYLVESRLLPVARKAGLGGLAELVAAAQRRRAPKR